MKINIVYPKIAVNTYKEWCLAFQDCFKKLGFDTDIKHEINSDDADIEIIQSYARFGEFEKKKNKRYIMIQGEHFPTYQCSNIWQKNKLDAFLSLEEYYDEVWDTFYPFHIDHYPKDKIVKHLKLGYHPIFDHSYYNFEYQHDTSFFGCVNEKRKKLLEKLNSFYSMDINGVERIKLIKNSKINLNIHFSDSYLLESLRILYLICNKAFILTETFIGDEDLKPFLIMGSYEEIPELVEKYLKNENDRERIKNEGYHYFKDKRTMVLGIEKCLR